MTAVIKEEKTMGATVKTYLEMYQEFIGGYKQYKMQKAVPAVKVEKTQNTAE
ncbi:hypothetical protein QOZ98_000243 [Planomicrobium stackebrandtii]|uniref:Uncharacterized protein n=1 Tax=Planomicrobium stackebrandtii TaxID=253160 RepID=A0ABU0GQS7_9BACL|nr:hypothetical protein [Planomicrobium stackebrandtii]MDQ0427418.1 hypothetical protein [Planomicrobium stackebrandtii]